MTRTKNRMCTGKKRFGSKLAAKSAISSMVAAGRARPGVMVAYQCKHCDGGWHVGHRVRRRHQK